MSETGYSGSEALKMTPHAKLREAVLKQKAAEQEAYERTKAAEQNTEYIPPSPGLFRSKQTEQTTTKIPDGIDQPFDTPILTSEQTEALLKAKRSGALGEKLQQLSGKDHLDIDGGTNLGYKSSMSDIPLPPGATPEEEAQKKMTLSEAWKQNVALGAENQQHAREIVKRNTEGLRGAIKKGFEVGRKVQQKTAETSAFLNSMAIEPEGRAALREGISTSIDNAREAASNKRDALQQAMLDQRDRAINATREGIRRLGSAIKDRVTQPAVDKTKAIGNKVKDRAKTGGLFVKATTYDAPKAAANRVAVAANTQAMNAAGKVADVNQEINFRAADWTHKLTFNVMKQGTLLYRRMQFANATVDQKFYSSIVERFRDRAAFKADVKASKATAEADARNRHKGPDDKTLKLTEKAREKSTEGVRALNQREAARQRSFDMKFRASELQSSIVRLRTMQRTPMTRPGAA